VIHAKILDTLEAEIVVLGQPWGKKKPKSSRQRPHLNTKKLGIPAMSGNLK
jgi:hypothetical protein